METKRNANLPIIDEVIEKKNHKDFGIKISNEKFPPDVWANLQSKENGKEVEMTDLVFAHYFPSNDFRLILVVRPESSSFETIALNPETGEKINEVFPDVKTMSLFLVDKTSLSLEVNEKILQYRQQD